MHRSALYLLLALLGTGCAASKATGPAAPPAAQAASPASGSPPTADGGSAKAATGAHTAGGQHAAALPFIEDDYNAALALAKTNKVPIFVEAWAPW